VISLRSRRRGVCLMVHDGVMPLIATTYRISPV
jgi:hypothetical protein